MHASLSTGALQQALGPFKGQSNFCNGAFLRAAVQFRGRLTGAPRKLVWVLMIDRPEGMAEAGWQADVWCVGVAMERERGGGRKRGRKVCVGRLVLARWRCVRGC